MGSGSLPLRVLYTETETDSIYFPLSMPAFKFRTLHHSTHITKTEVERAGWDSHKALPRQCAQQVHRPSPGPPLHGLLPGPEVGSLAHITYGDTEHDFAVGAKSLLWAQGR